MRYLLSGLSGVFCGGRLVRLFFGNRHHKTHNEKSGNNIFAWFLKAIILKNIFIGAVMYIK